MTPTHTGPSGRARHALRRGVAGVAVALAAALPLALAAQPAPPAPPAAAPIDTTPIPLTFSVPESPAFTFLGVSPAKVTRASSARDLGAALVNSIDSTGRVLTGVALGATLWTLLPSVKVDLPSYQTSWRSYALANAQLSVGSARAAGEGADTDVAFGLRTTFFDGSDPMRDTAFVGAFRRTLSACLRAVTRPSLPPPGASSATATAPTAPPADTAALACAGAANMRLRKGWFQKRWNAPALSWGGALGWRLARSEVESLDALGASTWLAGAYPLGGGGQLLGQLQYDRRNARDTVGATDVLTYGARAVRGSPEYNLFFEVAGTRRLQSALGVSRSNVQWSGGVEFEIAENSWLSTGFGRRYSALGRPDRVVLTANLRWGVSTKSRFRALSGPRRGA